MKVQIRSLALAAGLMVPLAGCASTPAAEEGAAAPAGDITVEVDNRNRQDVTVYAISGQRIRLGLVTAASQSVLRLQAGLVDPASRLRIRIDPIGAVDEYVSEPLLVRPGDRIAVTVTKELSNTTISVY